MEYVSVSSLESGMVLSGDLIAPNGRFILPKGAQLTPKTIMSIKIWGISQVPVEKSGIEEGAPDNEILFSSSVMEESRKNVLDRFSGRGPEWPVMEEIFSVAEREIASRLRGLGPLIPKFSTPIFPIS